MTRRLDAPPRTRGPKSSTVALRPRDASGHFLRPKEDWVPAFLRAFANSGNIRAACLASGTDRPTVTARREADPEFVTAWDIAEADAFDLLAAEGRRRALSISDTMLIYLLKVKGGKTWQQDGRQRIEHTGGGGGPIDFRGLVVELKLGDDNDD